MNKDHQIGKLGEDMAVAFLVKRGFGILDRNYRKKMGEIDIIAQKDNIIHFCEVKSVTRETVPENEENTDKKSLTKEKDTKRQNQGRYRPEDNVHAYKQKKISKVLQLYLLDKFKTTDREWEFSVITVEICERSKIAHVTRIPNIILLS